MSQINTVLAPFPSHFMEVFNPHVSTPCYLVRSPSVRVSPITCYELSSTQCTKIQIVHVLRDRLSHSVNHKVTTVFLSKFTPCSLVMFTKLLERTQYLFKIWLPPWRWSQYVPPKHCSLPARPLGVTSCRLIAPQRIYGISDSETTSSNCVLCNFTHVIDLNFHLMLM
jgi:hypothetical protein